MASKKSYSEEDIKRLYITPALYAAGWNDERFAMEKYFTDGRVIFNGHVHARQKGKYADYLLYDEHGQPLAVVEAKDNNKPVGGGMQQAMEYAQMLDVKFAYSSNGDAFLEHDFITGEEKKISLKKFPSPENLAERLANYKNYTPQEKALVDTAFYTDTHTYEPRYYQRIAVNRTIEAIARGENRVLIVMATGTGKTYTAFQIIHRLHKSKAKKKILYLADRNILIDQTMTQDFKPFRKFMTKVKDGKIDKAFEVYMALYHQLVGHEGEPDPFLQVNPDFFDLIIVDECHRGSAKDDSAWRKVLEYFKSATQIGMTATPKAQVGANNLDYFGEPIYTYSLLQGIQDGFLAPYRVTNSFINIDLQGYTPEEGEVDLYEHLIRQREYVQHDFGRNIAFLQRRIAVAKRITQMLHEIGRMTKTIVFCPDIEEAEEMRSLLVTMNSDMCKKDSRYVMRITGDSPEGKKQLDNFISVDEPYPTVVTTSELLATGVDCKTCGLIVIDKEISSMTEFKQIIGRGTRLRTDKGKWHLEILDFRNATRKFKDPEFDGEPESPAPPTFPDVPPTDPEDPDVPYVPTTPSDTEPKDPKYIVEGQEIKIQTEIVSVLGEDGKTMRTESLTSFTKQQITKHYQTLADFIKHWNEADKKEAIVREMENYDVLLEAIREKNPALAKADIFDIICHVAYDQEPLTRRERANHVKKRNYLAKFEGDARKVLDALLEKYADDGILEFENFKILENDPFRTFGKPAKIVKLFGGIQGYQKVVKEIETELYKIS